MELRRSAVGLAAGTLFGAGLAVAGMTNPNKVLNFLDVTRWDPSLAVVMGTAVPVSAAAFWLAGRRARPLCGKGFVLPDRNELDAPLLAGSALFGVGWGLGGYCPGPAVASLSHASGPLLGFVAMMAVGMLISGRLAQARAAPAVPEASPQTR